MRGFSGLARRAGLAVRAKRSPAQTRDGRPDCSPGKVKSSIPHAGCDASPDLRRLPTRNPYLGGISLMRTSDRSSERREQFDPAASGAGGPAQLRQSRISPGHESIAKKGFPDTRNQGPVNFFMDLSRSARNSLFGRQFGQLSLLATTSPTSCRAWASSAMPSRFQFGSYSSPGLW